MVEGADFTEQVVGLRRKDRELSAASARVIDHLRTALDTPSARGLTNEPWAAKDFVTGA
ncbi:hypothetical protein ACFYVR_08965 [Rhodococcus sp. NPDC003318]|uniref:hypothetical protein n=1 Tax=Rhodococcus sp. NPDC003318 TaxID=3364503 RepID=UPI0036C7BCA5